MIGPLRLWERNFAWANCACSPVLVCGMVYYCPAAGFDPLRDTKKLGELRRTLCGFTLLSVRFVFSL